MPPSSGLLLRLREATAAAHRGLETATASNRILNRELTPGEYDLIIDWQSRAHRALEPLALAYANPAYQYRSRREFLPGGRCNISETAVPSVDPLVALGTAYVLEGGSLGGAVIHRHLLNNEQLTERQPFLFYAAQAEFGVGQWKRYVAHLGQLSLSEAEQLQVVAAANAAFATFRRLWDEA